jgi:hypothetical protein
MASTSLWFAGLPLGSRAQRDHVRWSTQCCARTRDPRLFGFLRVGRP